MKKLILKYNTDRYTAMMVYDKLKDKRKDDKDLKDLHLSYLAGWVVIIGNIELITLTDKLVEFKINGKEFYISRDTLDGIVFE